MYKNLLLLSISVALSLLIAETAITWVTADPALAEAKKRGIVYDKRGRLEVILDNRKKDPNWFPAVPANTYLEKHLYLNDKRIVPLSGVANANIVGCNENGYFNTFNTDEIGFRNPPGTWPLNTHKYIFLVGDSFTQGDCVNDEDTIAGKLRRHYPHVVNLGVGGNGPILELASIREYVQDGKVSYVFWMYYEGNDLNDLSRDYGDELLRRYLQPHFKQSLLDQRDPINSIIRSTINKHISDKASSHPIILPKLREFLWQVRYKYNSNQKIVNGDQHNKNFDLFLKIIRLARDEVHVKGGTLVFVYLPEYNRLTGDPLSLPAKQRDSLLHKLSELDIPVVDAQKILMSHHTPASLLPFGLKGRHYTAEGYDLVAGALLRFLGSKNATSSAVVVTTRQ